MIKLKKKTIVAFTLVFSMVFGIAGCGKVKDLTTEQKATTASADSDVTKKPTTEEPSTEELTTEESKTTESTTEGLDPNDESVVAARAAFDEYIDALFKKKVVSDTVTLHYTLAHPENYGITDYEVTLGDTDMTESGFARMKSETEEDIAGLKKHDYTLLSDDQKFLYDILMNTYETDLKSYDNPYLFEPFAYTSGLQMNYPITMSEYKFYDKQDVEDYLKLLELTPAYYQDYLDFEKVKSEKGYFMNDNSADEVIRQCEGFIKVPDENILLETFENRIDKLEGITDAEKAAFIAENEKAVKEQIIPAYKNVIKVFKELKGTCKNELGIKYQKGGQDYYKYLMESKVGTDKTPEELIKMLEKAIDDSMSTLTTMAFTSYDAYEQYVEQYDNLYKDIDYKETIEKFEKLCDDKFPDIPDINFTVTPVHESLKDSVSPAFYMTPPLDEYLNNSIYVNEAGTSMGSLWSTLAHEGVPGHMYQFVYFLSSNPSPIRAICSFSGYEEGWAQYIELMSYDYYEDFSNPAFAKLEKINGELNLLVSARVEIGVNYEGWTVEETETYLSTNGFGADAAQSIFDYVVAEPGNYQMYCIGMLSFRELRAYAEDALGDQFDEKEFHKTVLDAGPCQFFLLKQKVEAYIAGKK